MSGPIYGNVNGIKNGDLVEIYEYNIEYNGIQGVVHSAPRDDSIWAFTITDNARSARWKKGQTCNMFVGNLRLVDDSKSFIPEDWS